MQKTEKILKNSKVKDSGAKIIFEDNILCAQFLRDYVDLEAFKEVSAEDIVDVSSQYVPLFEEERNADRVKKIRVKNGKPYFLVSLIEHKTQVDYNVTMQIFRYMVCIWTDYEKEMEKRCRGISKRSDFTYPPIIPIVYYEGKEEWTACESFKSRIANGEYLGGYVPDFRYYLVPVHQYSNESLLRNGDEISLVMLINKLQSEADVAEFKKIPPERVQAILDHTPEYLREIISDIFMAFLLKANVPAQEAVEMASKVREKHMAELFGNMDKIDVQAARREVKQAKEELNAKRKELEESQKELEENHKAIEESRKTIENNKRTIENNKRTIEDNQKTLEESIKTLVQSCRMLGATKEFTCSRMKSCYRLSEKEIKEKVELYWNCEV